MVAAEIRRSHEGQNSAHFCPNIIEDGNFPCDGLQFDNLFVDCARFTIGAIRAVALNVPGHTPADMAYIIGDAAFVGDTVFMSDYGRARADFPGSDARTLFRSIRRLME